MSAKQKCDIFNVKCREWHQLLLSYVCQSTHLVRFFLKFKFQNEFHFVFENKFGMSVQFKNNILSGECDYNCGGEIFLPEKIEMENFVERNYFLFKHKIQKSKQKETVFITVNYSQCQGIYLPWLRCLRRKCCTFVAKACDYSCSQVLFQSQVTMKSKNPQQCDALYMSHPPLYFSKARKNGRCNEPMKKSGQYARFSS